MAAGSEDLLWRPSVAADMRRYALAAAAVLALGAGAGFGLTANPDGAAVSDADDAVILDLPPALASSAPPAAAAPGPDQPAVDAAPSVPAVSERKPDEPPPDAARPDSVEPVAADKQPETPPVAPAAAQEAMAPAGTETPTPQADAIDSEAAGRRAAQAAAQWQRAMLARLDGAKRGVQGGGAVGTVAVAFTIDRAGRLLTSRVVKGSGSPRLDQMALTLLAHAAPFPDPPAGLADTALSFTVPIAFARHR